MSENEIAREYHLKVSFCTNCCLYKMIIQYNPNQLILLKYFRNVLFVTISYVSISLQKPAVFDIAKCNMSNA